MIVNDIEQDCKYIDSLHALLSRQPYIRNFYRQGIFLFLPSISHKQAKPLYICEQLSKWRLHTLSKEPLRNLFIQVTLGTGCDHFPASRDFTIYSLLPLHDTLAPWSRLFTWIKNANILFKPTHTISTFFLQVLNQPTWRHYTGNSGYSWKENQCLTC